MNECNFSLSVFDYVSLGVLFTIVVLFLYEMYKDYLWKKKYWVCDSCGKDCHSSSTFGNILDKNRNWTCYHCNETNYTFKVSKKRL